MPQSSFATLCAMLLAALLPDAAAAADTLIAPTAWSGKDAHLEDAAQVRTPDRDQPVRFRWEKGNGRDLATMSGSFPAQNLASDVLAFWLRVDRPLEKLDIVLSDADGVGAETSVLGLFGRPRLEPGHWYYVVWPFRVSPGWVRYTRTRVDWERTVGVSFLTWPDQVPTPVHVELGPLRVLGFSQLESIFSRFPERPSHNRSLPWRVLREKRDDMMGEYFRRRFAQAIATLRASWPAERVARQPERLRQALAATYLMPTEKATVSSTLQGIVTLNGIRVEKHLLRLRRGVGSPALLFLPTPPAKAAARQPAILMLPGHGDPFWTPGMQERCLSFAKRGWIVLLVEPFGQTERGENPRWSEGHDSQAMAFLLTVGQSLMGLIMADHQAELSWLLTRQEVDPQRVAVTGVSMGGTHSLWFAALDSRARAAVAVAVAPLARANWGAGPQGQCDLMVGMFQVADDELIRALVAPRPLMEICPAVQAPLTSEGERLLREGQIDQAAAMKRYAVTAAQIPALHPLTRQTYALLGAEGRYAYEVIDGPHDYTKSMRQRAAGFLTEWWAGGNSGASLPESAMQPLRDRQLAQQTLCFWSAGRRPADILSPTAYVQRELGRLVERLAPPPKTRAAWQAKRDVLRRQILGLLGTPLDVKEVNCKTIGRFRAEQSECRKLVAEADAGIEIPMHLFAPAAGVRPDGRLVVLLHPEGTKSTSASEERRHLTAAGAWVVCPDLRSTGETHFNEQGGYNGFRDYDVGIAALKLGETLAGYWVRDCLVAIAAARQATDGRLKVAIHGEGEMGLIALLVAAHQDDVAGVQVRGLLASYYSAAGYGLPFAYADEKNDKSVRGRKLFGYGSIAPCIPHLLKYADIPQIMALVAPRPLRVIEPKWASGEVVPAAARPATLRWTSNVYALYGCRLTLD